MPPPKKIEEARERAFFAMVTIMGAVFGLLFPPLLALTPVPLSLLIYRHGSRAGTVTALLAGLASGFVVGPMGMVTILLILGLGVSIGEGLRNKLSLTQILGVSWAVAFLGYFGGIYAARLMQNQDVIVEIDKALENLLSAGGQAPLSKEEIALLINQVKQVLPAAIALSALGMTLVNYWIAGRWLQRLGVQVPRLRPFSRWYFPQYLAWVYIAGVAFSLLGGLFSAGIVAAVVANLLMLGGAAYLVQGTAIVWFFMEKRQVKGPLKAAVIGILVFAYLTQMVYIVLPLIVVGVLDTWFNFRRLERS